ncbi:unnamed protein product, partial [Brassica oleracea var. botrytis]
APIFNNKACDDLAHVEKIIRFFSFLFYKKETVLRYFSTKTKHSEALPSWRESSRRPPNLYRLPRSLIGEEISPCFDPFSSFP